MLRARDTTTTTRSTQSLGDFSASDRAHNEGSRDPALAPHTLGRNSRVGLVVRRNGKKRRTYNPHIVGGQVMMPADLKRLHKYMLEIEGIDHISDEMRAVVESEWPELAHKLPPKKPQG
jgi:hypothetical protein